MQRRFADPALLHTLRALAFSLLCAVGTTAASGQTADLMRAIEAHRQQANSGTVGVISGGVDGTYIRIAADLASVLDDSSLRVLAMIGKGSVQNISDILYLRGIDIGIVQSDALAYVRKERLFPGVDKNLQYIAKLYNEEFHLLARKEIGSVHDLAGKKVNVDVTGSGTSMTASLLFSALGVNIEAMHNDQAVAVDQLKRGEIAALAYIAGKPARLFRDLRTEDGVHFLPIPISQGLLETYIPSELSHVDYPSLLDPATPIETVAVGAVMAVYGWAPDTDRYAKVARFTEKFFGSFDAFTRPPRHPKWKEVNLAAQVPGWKRFAPAEAWLRRQAATVGEGSSQRQAFDAFIAQSGAPDTSRLSPGAKEKLFQEFLGWQARSQSPSQ